MSVIYRPTIKGCLSQIWLRKWKHGMGKSCTLLTFFVFAITCPTFVFIFYGYEFPGSKCLIIFSTVCFGWRVWLSTERKKKTFQAENKHLKLCHLVPTCCCSSAAFWVFSACSGWALQFLVDPPVLCAGLLWWDAVIFCQSELREI